MFFSIFFAALQADPELLDMPLQTLPLPQLKKPRGNTFTTQTACKLKDREEDNKREGRGKGRGRREVQV